MTVTIAPSTVAVSDSFDLELTAAYLTVTLANGKALKLNGIIIHAAPDAALSVKYSLNENVKSKVINLVDKSYQKNKSYEENQSNGDKSFRENPINLLNKSY